MIFGPKNFKMDLDEAKNYAHRLLLDLDFQEISCHFRHFKCQVDKCVKLQLYHFGYGSDIIVVDEPTADLTLKAKTDYALIKIFQTEENKTIILVSHDMNDVARYADEVIV